MYTSDIENRRHRSLLEHPRRQVADVDVVKIEFAGGGICGGRKTTALNSDVTRSPAIAEGPRDAGVPVEIW